MLGVVHHDDVVEIVLANPPVNALSVQLRSALAKALSDALSFPHVRGVVIRGQGSFFCGGADINELEQHNDPWLPDLIDRIEAAGKPVIAAIQGDALGGGLELAMGCHYRLATPSAKLGLPEVKLGILPGAGGTQRLPRLAGAETALDMIVWGEPISALRALERGIVDRIVDQDRIVAEAVAYARSGQGIRRTRELPFVASDEAFDLFKSKNTRRLRGLHAPAACVEAVRAAAQLSFDEGLRREHELFIGLVKGEQSLALRHLFFAERSARKIEGLGKDIARRTIRKVGVIGGGTMGTGISINFLSRGIPLTIIEMDPDGVARARNFITASYNTAIAKGNLSEDQVEKALSLLEVTHDFSALSGCDLVIEAVYEDIELKKDVFRRLDRIADSSAILATNTSFLDVNKIAAVTSRPNDVLGLHFFSPANIMKLVEVVRGTETGPDVLATAIEVSRKIGKVPVVAGVCDGFIGNRMLTPRQANAEAMLVEGATPEQIDRVHIDFGMPMGPFQMLDLAGLDVGWHRNPARIDNIKDAICSRGRLGQKTKAGFYDYGDDRKPRPSEVVEQIVGEFRERAGIPLRRIADEEIVVRTLYTMVNEGAKILEEGIAQRASDINVVWVYGYGWPRHKGGPMYWAERIGLQTIVDGLTRYRDRLGSTFTLSPLLKKRAAEGRSLNNE
ncbi:enoyl-CoA hydratase/isomerase family protein [Ensifer sp. ENS07]|uniref:3-hydroxyacyl-CoA dehydrogenase NAD-binding domain-containing protein n=1 Tax=Ensifer sp. ENS07 TaxID=2769274 RepID=UPI00177E3967|nr:3-hydroxyacyl-CoA dehydrogenase NAD-binding domain-containing protein [Ensifer sp. ENS07]MBD9641774.1 enoyl-CoA hydratase/isomerase family protein [Ensifer sp. ENS07]